MTTYSIWAGGDLLVLGDGEVLAQNFFADESAAARANGDELRVGPINCPNPGNLADPLCGPTQFGNAMKTVKNVPAGANLTIERRGPELIPDPPFGQ